MAFFRRRKEPETENRAVWDGGAGYGMPWIPDWHTNSSSAAYASDLDAMTIPAFMRGVAIKADLVSGFPLQAYENEQKLDFLPALLRQPDPTEFRSTTIAKMVNSLLLRGNAYALLDYDEFGFVRALKTIHPANIAVRVYPSGEYTYMIGEAEYSPNDILHIKNSLIMPGEYYGLNIVQSARRALDRAIRTEEFGRIFFADNATPSAVVTIKDPNVTSQELDDARDRWVARQRGSRAPVFLRGEISFEPLSITPEDSQFIETEIHSLTTIAQIVGLPGSMLGAHGSSMTYQNVEQENINLLNFYLPEVRKIEEAFTSLLPEGMEAKFNVDALLRNDASTRATTEKTWVESGVYTVNELRAKENLPPLAEPVAPASALEVAA